ncbi:MAG: hypothetical protein J6C46_01140, partial [Clostridia bacterium]|nr:hypothetical protein [Clostridia bacterium]
MSRKIKVCFWVILMFLVINCGSVFAINLNQLNNLLKVYNVWSISEQNKIKIVNYSNEYKYFIIGQAGNDNNNLLYIFTNLEPKYYESASWYTSFLVKDPNGIYYESNIQGFRSYPNTYVRLVKDNYY